MDFSDTKELKNYVNEYLGQIRRHGYLIENKMDNIRQLRELAYGTGFCTDGERVQTSGSKDPMGNAVTEIVCKESELEEQIESCVKKRAEIIKQLEGLENMDYYNILYKHYVSFTPLKDIGSSLHISGRHISRLYNEALVAFGEKYFIS